MLGAILLTTIRVAAAASAKEFGAAINVAGRQRMLSQKMTKEFLLVALKVDPAANKASLKQTMDLFDSSLTRLQKGDADLSIPSPPTPAIQGQLEKVKTSWASLRPALEKGLAGDAVAPDAVAEVAKLSSPVLEEMHKTVGMYEDASKAAGVKTAGTVINVAGRQRMLSQKMAKEILLLALKVNPDGTRAELDTDAQLFAKSLKGLVSGDEQLGLPPTTAQSIVKQMGTVESIWKEFDGVITQARSTPDVPPDTVGRVADLSSKLLTEMNRAVTMYEAEAN